MPAGQRAAVLPGRPRPAIRAVQPQAHREVADSRKGGHEPSSTPTNGPPAIRRRWRTMDCAPGVGRVAGPVKGVVMQKRKLGNSGLEVSAIGLGCMSMSFGYGPPDDRQKMIEVVRTAVARGVSLFDTSYAYSALSNDDIIYAAVGPFHRQRSN